MTSAVVNFTGRRPASASRAAEGSEASADTSTKRSEPRRTKAILSAVVVVLGAILGIVHLATVLAVATAGHGHSYLAFLVLALLAVPIGHLYIRLFYGADVLATLEAL